MPRAKADGITRASTGTMLRKQILPSPLIPSSRRGKDVASVATVFVTSEDPDHPIDYAFDGRRGPDGSRWIAGNVGEQTLILAFDGVLSSRLKTLMPNRFVSWRTISSRKGSTATEL